MKLLVAESEGFAPAALSLLRTKTEVIEADLDRKGLLQAAPDADILWVRLRTLIDVEVLDAAPRLKFIVTNTTGLNHIDLDTAQTRGIRVLSLRGEVDFLNEIRATAELALGLALALVRRIPAAHEHACDGQWDRYQCKGNDLYEKTAGIVGYGRLGRIVAGYCRSLGMRAVATTLETERLALEAGVNLVPLDKLLSESDLVSLHVNLTPDNRKMSGPEQFARMRPGAWLINTARGELIDEPALLWALRSGHLGGAALDVIADEHRGTGRRHPLIEYARNNSNLVLTPHIGGYTRESLHKTEFFLAQRLVEALETKPVG